MTTQNIKEKLNKGMENLRKKELNRNKETLEGHSSRLVKVEDRISELEHKIEIKEKTEEILVNQLNSCEKNIHKLTKSIKTPNLRIMGIEEREEVQEKRIHNIFIKIITKNFTNLKKFCPFR
jgi:chromosome segregation ATPase